MKAYSCMVWLFTTGLSCLLICVSNNAFAAEFKPGDLVIVSQDTKLVSDGKEIGDGWPGQPAVVQEVQAGTLRINNGQLGWVNRSCVLSADQSAIDYLNTLLVKQPDNVRLILGRASTWNNLGRTDLADKECRQVLKVDPENAQAYKLMADLSYATFEFEESIEGYNKSLKYDQKNSLTYQARGWAYFNEGESDRALSDFDEALKLAPGTAEALSGRGLVWHGKQEYEKSVADFSEVIRQRPDGSSAYTRRGHTWLALKENEKAIVDFRKSIELGDTGSMPHSLLGSALLIQRSPDALDAFLKAYEVDPEAGHAAIMGYLSARILDQQIDAEQFRELSNSVAAEWPYEFVQYLNGRMKKAQMMKTALSSGELTQLHCYLGLECLANKNDDDAKKHFEWVRDHGVKTFIEFTISNYELSRIKAIKK
ncbi:tetratricopeptide repeat protein [Lacunimicrobium album]